MKKWIALISSFTIALSMGGCSSNDGKANTTAGQTKDGAEPTNINSLLKEPIEGEITVSCYDALYYKDFLENAAKAFELKYPGTKIHIDASSQMPSIKSSDSEGEKIVSIETEEDTQGQTDYINRINTALMSGGGADIFAIDIIPYYKYAENNQLENLLPYMDADPEFNITDYKSNILNAVQYRNGQYIFPLDYAFNYYEYDNSLFDDAAINSFNTAHSFPIEQLLETAENTNGKTAEIIGLKGYTDPQTGTSMFHELFLDNYHSFVDIENKKASFTDGQFAQLLDTVMAWETKGYILPSSATTLTVDDFSTAADQQYYYKLKSNIELLLGHLRTIEGWQINIPVAGVSPSTTDHDAVAGLSVNENGAIRFSYSQAYGINANSRNKKLAWEFIKFMASQEIQETLQFYSGSLIGLPIHNEARSSKARDGITGELFIPGEEPAASKELTAQQQMALDDYIATVEVFSDMLNTFPVMDVTINTIINAEVKAFFAGKATSQDTAAAIQSKVEMYLNE